MSEDVSASPADWTKDQLHMASYFGTCLLCGAPRDAIATELPGGGIRMEMGCLNGHREPGI